MCLNLRWLARLRDPAPETWAQRLVEMTRDYLTTKRATELLRGAVPTEKEIALIAEITGHEPEQLTQSPIYGDASSVRRENIRFLLAALKHRKGEGRLAAKEMGISPSQLSRWRKQVEKPRLKNIKALLRFLGIDTETDLDRVPLFLALEPLSGHEQKRWILRRVQETSNDEISRLYPALRKMFREDGPN